MSSAVSESVLVPATIGFTSEYQVALLGNPRRIARHSRKASTCGRFLRTFSDDSEKLIITSPRFFVWLSSRVTQNVRPAGSAVRPRTFWYTRSTNWPLFSDPYLVLNSDEPANLR